MMVVASIGLLLIVIAGAGATSQRHDRRTSAAHEILDARLADGEITPDEHQQRNQVLADVPPRRASPGAWWLLAGLGAILLLAGPVTAPAGPGAGWWAGHPMTMADHMGWTGTAAASAEPPVSGAPEVVVEAGELWFAPVRIDIAAGTTTNLVLDNTGQVFHDLSIPALDVHLEAAAGQSAATALGTPAAGTYEFLCSVPGHAAGGMRGELVVTAASGN